MICCTGLVFYVESFYRNYVVGQFTKFPDPVAKKLRRALYYTNWDLQPKNALKYYVETLQVAEELGMSPFSDEIMGVKVQLAAFMEKIQEYQKAIQILKILKNDNLRWIEAAKELPGYAANRTRILGKTVGVSVKLGELYANQYVMETGNAEKELVWAVETVLKEQKRREVEGVKPDEGDWMSPEEIGGSLEGQYSLKSHSKANVISIGSSLRRKRSALSCCSSFSSGFNYVVCLKLPYHNIE